MAEDAASVKAWNARLVAYVKILDHEATRRGSQLRYTYKSVAKALADFPVRITTAAEAQQIKGVGPMIGRQLENYVNNTLLPEQQQAMQQDQAAAAAAAPGIDGGGEGGGGLEGEKGSRDSLDAMMEDLVMASQSTVSFADMEETYPALAQSKASSSSTSTSSSRRRRRGTQGAESSRARGAASKVAFSSSDDGTILVLSDDDDENDEEEEEEKGGGEDKENVRRLPNAAGRKASSMRQQQRQQQQSVVMEVIDVSEDEDEDERQEEETQEEEHEDIHSVGLKAGGDNDDDDSVLVLVSDSEEEEEDDEVEVEEAKDRSNNSRTIPPPPPPSLPAPLPSVPPSSSSKGKGRKRKLFSPPKVYKQTQLGFGGSKLTEEEEEEGNEEEEEEEDLDGPITIGRLHRLCRHFEGTQAEEWEVVLLLDRREHENNPSIERGLIQAGVRCELRVLQLGDMLWVARRRQLSSSASSSSGASSKEEEKARKEREMQEVMLRYVIERKTVGDLAASIKDGRYKEQKGRMLGVGKEVDRAFYLVEGTFEQLNDVIRPPALRTALATTQVIHGLPVLRTRSLDQTILLLLRMHARIVQGVKGFLEVACLDKGKEGGREGYLEKHLCALPLPPSRIISLGEYQERCKKTAGDLSVRSMFLMQLCAIDKVSEAKSKAVVSVHPTPMALVRAMREVNNEAEAVALLAGLPVAGHRQSLGRVAAVNIYNVYR